jgi:hypothetical protein
MSTIILLALVLGAPAAAYTLRRRSRARKLGPGSAGRVVIAANLVDSRHR